MCSITALLNEVEEEFAQLEFISPDLDKLRNAILKAHAPLPDLDSETLTRHLIDDGFAKTVEGVLSAQVLNHAAFARVDADAETVRLGWADTRSRFEKRRLGMQIRDAERDFAGDMSVENGRGCSRSSRTRTRVRVRCDGWAAKGAGARSVISGR